MRRHGGHHLTPGPAMEAMGHRHNRGGAARRPDGPRHHDRRLTRYLQHHALDADRASAAGSGGRRRMFLISGTDSTTAVSATMIKPPKVSRVEVPKKLASGAATTTQAGAKA